ncbi:MAG TPA: hypothetical protein VGK00_18520 [Anaerolineales bacterium]|jgi:hypothetical protein
MISTSDIIRLTYTSDLTEGGITFATRSLAFGFDHLSGSIYSRLRRNVGEAAVGLVFRRYLGEQGIPFNVIGALPFSEPDRYDVNLGGRRCNLNSYVTSKRSQITAMRRDPSVLLQAPAMVPEDQLTNNPREQDLQLFSFLLGLTTNSPEDIQKAVDAGQPTYLIHPFRADWAHPQAWVSLGRLSFKSECSTPVNIEVGGLDAGRNFISETIALAPLTRSFARNEYNSLAFIHTEKLPEARVGVQSSGKGAVYIIQPHEWGNIWIYGMEIWLAGYLAQDEFRRKASTIFAGSRVFQYSKTQAKNLSVPVIDLRPLDHLFEQVVRWEADKRSW